MTAPATQPRSRAAATNGKKRKVVALLVETSNAYARGLLRGIAARVHERGWSVYLSEHGRGEGRRDALPPAPHS